MLSNLGGTPSSESTLNCGGSLKQLQKQSFDIVKFTMTLNCGGCVNNIQSETTALNR